MTMTSMMPDSMPEVIGGVDTHRDIHVAAALDSVGRVVGTAQFPASGAGYRRLLRWLQTFGAVSRVGVEGTGSWGAGLSRFLGTSGIEVVEVIRPNRQYRRRHGRSDTTDAIAAARAVLSGEASGPPRGGEGPVESLRLLRIARRSAMKHRTGVANQIHSVVATGPEPLRAQLRAIKLAGIVDIAARYRPGNPADPHQAAKITLKALATRYQRLTAEITGLDSHIQQLVTTEAPPPLLALCGVGPQTAADLLITAGTNPHRLRTAASFAALCGTSPVDASSGKQQRHRLNRGGDRQANAALYRMVMVRLRYHPPTRHYMARRLAEGRTKPEIIRCLKRYLAGTIQRILTGHPT
jgi:transposase